MTFEITGRAAAMFDPPRVGMHVFGVYCAMGVMSAAQPDNAGWIQRCFVEDVDPDGSATARLLELGLWTEQTHQVDDTPGYRFVLRPAADAAPWCRFVAGYARPVIPERVRLAVFERDDWRCQGHWGAEPCMSTQDLTLDHDWPFSLGGGSDEDNLVTLCRSCNSRKGARV